jgi:hypothetical protein
LLGATPPDKFVAWLTGYRRGLKSAGFTQGENVAIEYRRAESNYDRLPALAAELAHTPVSVWPTDGCEVRSVAHEATELDERAIEMELNAAKRKKYPERPQAPQSILGDTCKGCIDLVVGASMQKLDLRADGSRGSVSRA